MSQTMKISECPVIVCIADDKYSMPLAVVLCSIVENLKKYKKVHAIVVGGGISPQNRKRVSDSVCSSKIDLEWIVPDKEFTDKLKNLKTFAWLNIMTYYRLILPDLLEKDHKKVIVLDTDVIVKGDISQLWDEDLDDQYVAAAQNLDWFVSSSRGLMNYKQLGLDPKLKYFNAGVMVVNLENWRRDATASKILHYLVENDDYIRWCDQDGLNAVLAGQWKEVDALWNYEAIPNPYDEEKICKANILHFTGPKKPWHHKFSHPTQDLFFEYLDKTDWAGWRPRPDSISLYTRMIFATQGLRRTLGLTREGILQRVIDFKVFILRVKIGLGGAPNLRGRLDLPIFLRSLNLTGKGVEVGVFKGEYSDVILRKSKLRLLYSVDPWREFGKDEYVDILNVSEEEQYKAYLITVKKLSKYKNRSRVLRTTSEEAVKQFKDGELDFVYIDAQHSYEACKEDLAFWWPKLKTGGIFSGHDYVTGDFPEGKFGVKSAVDEFAQKCKLSVNVINDSWPTWYVLKK